MLEFIPRKGSKCLKYDALKERFGREDLLPLWVADMDCRAPSCVQQAIAQQLEHGIYGYSSPEQSEISKNAIRHWLATRHSVPGPEQRDCLIFAGVLEALAVCIELFSNRGDAVLLNGPAYNGFYTTIKASGRNIVENYLKHDGSIDFVLLEQQIKESRARIFLFCSPHNPTGKVWAQSDILQLLHLCQKYSLYLISDEIHFDLVYSGHEHLSILRQEFSNIHDKIIMISAPSKTFNIPALRSAYLISKNQTLLKQIELFCRQFQIGDISLLGHLALAACYTRTQAVLWLDELLQHLEKNRNLLHRYLTEEFPRLQHYKPDGTYLYWVDCRNLWAENTQALEKFFLTAGLALGWGDIYHGKGWVRINFACALPMLAETLAKWKKQAQSEMLSV